MMSKKKEVNYLKSVLIDHLEKYNAFKSFTKTAADALKIADALLKELNKYIDDQYKALGITRTKPE
jgi:hypothetical protein